jgi:hypothetical protein
MIDEENGKKAELIAAVEAHFDAIPNLPESLCALDLDRMSQDELATMKKHLDLVAAIDRLEAVAGKDIRFDIPLADQFDPITLAALALLKKEMDTVLGMARSLRGPVN